MHYKNGREAKNGDKVVIIPPYPHFPIQSGILYDAQPGNNLCNGRLASFSNQDPIANLSECLHMDDAKELLNAK